MGIRVTGLWSAIGAGILGVMLADLVHNAAGTKTLTDSAVQVEKVGVNGLLGQTS